MRIFTINYQISGMPSTLIYRVRGTNWENVGPKLYFALVLAGGKVGATFGRMTFEEFASSFDEQGAAIIGEFEIRSEHPNDEHIID